MFCKRFRMKPLNFVTFLTLLTKLFFRLKLPEVFEKTRKEFQKHEFQNVKETDERNSYRRDPYVIEFRSVGDPQDRDDVWDVYYAFHLMQYTTEQGPE